MRRTTPPLAAVLVLAALAACSGGAGDESARTASPSPSGSATTTATTTSAAPVAPLTGLRVDAVARRPALVVKIENSRAARPQSGLGQADLVVEELVEGGITRFAALYQSTVPAGRLGPVRSLRDVDPEIASPTRGLLASSGAAGVVMRRARRAPVQLLTPSNASNAFSRTSSRPVPHNLYADARRLWAHASSGHRAAPAPYLPFAPDAAGAAPAAGTATSTVSLRFSPAERPRWTYQASSGQWLRSEGTAAARTADGRRITADTLVVLRVRTRDAGYRDPVGNPVPRTVLTGSGALTVVAGGRRVDGTWHKADRDAPFRFTTRSGRPLLVPPGRAWLELVPPGGAVTYR